MATEPTILSSMTQEEIMSWIFEKANNAKHLQALHERRDAQLETLQRIEDEIAEYTDLAAVCVMPK